MIAKKLAIAAASAALVLGAFAPAFADSRDGGNGGVSIDNSGEVNVVAVNLSNSGLNNVSASHDGEVEHSSVTTGASSASLTVGTEVNANTVVANCGCSGKISLDNDTDVTVFAFNGSNSGLNNVSANDAEVEGSSVSTGASSATGNVQTLVNVNSVTVTGGNSN